MHRASHQSTPIGCAQGLIIQASRHCHQRRAALRRAALCALRCARCAVRAAPCALRPLAAPAASWWRPPRPAARTRLRPCPSGRRLAAARRVLCALEARTGARGCWRGAAAKITLKGDAAASFFCGGRPAPALWRPRPRLCLLTLARIIGIALRLVSPGFAVQKGRKIDLRVTLTPVEAGSQQPRARTNGSASFFYSHRSSAPVALPGRAPRLFFGRVTHGPARLQRPPSGDLAAGERPDSL